MKINAIISPSGAPRSVNWKSTKTSIATVDKKGYVTGRKKGTVTIKATAANGWKASYSFRVYDPVTRRGLVIVDASATNGTYSTPASAQGEIKANYANHDGFINMFKRNGIYASSILDAWDASEVQSGILSALSDADDDDVSYIYINAHGGYDQNSGTFWICVGNRNSGNYWITADQLRYTLDQIRGTKVIMLDSCYSGAVIDKGSKGGESAASPEAAAQGFIRSFMGAGRGAYTSKTGEMIGSGYYLLCSASKSNKSYYFWDWKRLMGEPVFTGSAFAYAICRGSGWNMCRDRKLSYYADSSRNGRVSMRELYKYAASTMKTIYKKTRVPEPATLCMYPSNSSFSLFPK